ncbi:hypothetical protein D3C71_2206620 [compost metagenome]
MYVLNAAFVHVAWGNVAGRDQVAEPVGGVGVDFVVVGARHITPPAAERLQ